MNASVPIASYMGRVGEIHIGFRNYGMGPGPCTYAVGENLECYDWLMEQSEMKGGRRTINRRRLHARHSDSTLARSLSLL